GDASSARPVPLPQEQAFPFYVSETEPGHYQITWEPAPQHYLYRHGFRVGFQAADTAEDYDLSYRIPAGISKVDQFFGRVEVYYERVVVDVPAVPAAATGAALLIEFQGCAEWGFCYPPQHISFPLLPR
ncbi:MAG: protein-disulfide reductase DsbD N-terminal domain-containing protein, partial [Gammaproteobacteria bacterium]